jgi:hypothetical protein
VLTSIPAGRAGRGATLLAVVALVTALLVVAGPRAASAAAGCPKEIPWCTVSGGGGGSGGDDGASGCSYEGHAVACYLPNFGYYKDGTSCYYLREDPQPPLSNPAWDGHTPDQGAIYEVSCFDGPPPWGTGAVDQYEQFQAAGIGMTPYQVALEALAALTLPTPTIGMAPDPANVTGGLVGLPVWMWVKNTWGPIHSRKTDGGITVRLTARVTKAVWSMGDGHSVTCKSSGTPYTAAAGGASSPSCGYEYVKPSTGKAGGKYKVAVTETWIVSWTGGGDGDVFPAITRSSSTTVRINEQQVVVK